MSDLKKRQFDEMVSFFNQKVAEMNIARKYKMELLGMITAIALEHDRELPKWIPFTTREPTEEEHELYPDWTNVLDCPLPEDGDDVLLTDGKYVWEDTFNNDEGCYFDRVDIEDWEKHAWMPMPKPPYRGEDESNNGA